MNYYKKKMSRIFVMLLTTVVFLTGCGQATQDNEKKEIVANEKETQVQEEEYSYEQSEISSEDAEVTIEEQVLLEQDGIKITAKGITEDSIWGEGIELLIENDSDKNISVGCNALIVNDYMISDLFAQTVATGKKANEVMYMSSSELEAAGITNIGKIEIYFHVYDDDSYDKLFDSDCITILTSQYENMDTTPVDEGQELYNQDGIRIVGKYVDENSFWGTAVLLYMENTTNQNVGISCDNMSINGFMVTPYFSSTIYAGKKAVSPIHILSTDLENSGITSVEELEVNFHIYNEDTYDTVADTGAIAFSVQ